MWSTAELSEARSRIAAIGVGEKIFFAGGDISDGTCATKTVDIFDVSNNRWSASSLSIPGSKVVPAAVGNKVLFAGGDAGFCGTWARGTTVDIYDLTTNAWSSTSLSSVRRGGHAAVTVNNKVFFSGGETWPDNPVPGSWYVSSTVDIYDEASNSWSISSLSEGKLGHAGVVANDKIFWAGGKTGYFPNITSSCKVEIRNVSNGSVSIQQLSKPGPRTGVIKNNQLIFYAGDDKFDVYDVATDKWSIGMLPMSVSGASIISVNNTIYLAGGAANGVLSYKVWKLEF
jgi:N-acetylneuraminic acid mutarotase